jgi:hypothetical protein
MDEVDQPVMIQSFADEFDLPDDAPQLPAPPGEILTRNAGDPLDAADGAKHPNGTRKAYAYDEVVQA